MKAQRKAMQSAIIWAWLVSMTMACKPAETEPGTSAQPRGGQVADKVTADKLQALATTACQCDQQSRGGDWSPWSPAPLGLDDMAGQTPPCWQEFDKALRPYDFTGGPVAACGPGSEHEYLTVGRDQAFADGPIYRDNADGTSSIIQPPKDRPQELYEIHLRYGFNTCSQAEADKRLAEYNARQAEKGGAPGCG